MDYEEVPAGADLLDYYFYSKLIDFGHLFISYHASNGQLPACERDLGCGRGKER